MNLRHDPTCHWLFSSLNPEQNFLENLKKNSETPSTHPHHVKLIAIYMHYWDAITSASYLIPPIFWRCFRWYPTSHVYTLDDISHLTLTVPFRSFHTEEVRFNNFPNPFVIYLLHYLSINSLISCSDDSTQMTWASGYSVTQLYRHTGVTFFWVSVITFSSFFIILSPTNPLLETIFLLLDNDYVLFILFPSTPSPGSSPL